MDPENSQPTAATAMHVKREDVARILYEWLHENQVTHRRIFDNLAEQDKQMYRTVAERVIGRASQP